MTRPTDTASPGTFWDVKYREEPFFFGTAPNVWLEAQRERFETGMRVLVPGDGEGRNGVFLATLGAAVTTVDASRVGVDKARALAQHHGVAIAAEAADLTSWPWPVAAFDAVVSIYLHWPSNVRARMHKAMADALVPGGFLLLEGYTPRHAAHQAAGSLGGPRDVSMLFEPADLARDFAGLEIEQCAETTVTLAEGSRHVGPSAVVRLVARKPL